jgi:hypothetical protein
MCATGLCSSEPLPQNMQTKQGWSRLELLFVFKMLADLIGDDRNDFCVLAWRVTTSRSARISFARFFADHTN